MMFKALSFVTILATLQTVDAAVQHLHHPNAQIKVKDVKAFAPAAPLKVTENVLPLKRSGQEAKGSTKALHRLATGPSNTPLIPSQGGIAYDIEIDFGGQLFTVIFDTGSSDLWLPSSNLSCFDFTSAPVPLEDCGFRPLYNGTFSEGAIANQNMELQYGDGEWIIGVLGYEDVCIAGIEVEHQEVALIYDAYWQGDNVTSGLCGFAYPALTSAYNGTDPIVDNPSTQIPYNNWLFTAIARNLISPMFSVAIERGADGGGGQLAIGGLPDVSFAPTFASTPLRILELNPSAIGATNYTYYTIIPDGFVVMNASSSDGGTGPKRHHSWHSIHKHATNSTGFPVIVDSGTTLMYLPDTLAAEVNAAFNPPATYIADSGLYETVCDAQPPFFAVVIDGLEIIINPLDLILTGDAGTDPSTGLCVTGVQGTGGSVLSILGDSFMKNVVAVFDIGASMMRFAVHLY